MNLAPTSTQEPLVERLRDLRALFLVWGPPSHGPRSTVFARELGIPIEFVWLTRRRGALVAPAKYVVQAVRTVGILARHRPRVVWVQSPPSFAVMVVALYCATSGCSYVVDAHSDAMQSPYWTRPRWLIRVLARRALATLVTNERYADRVREWGATAMVVPDVPTTFPGTRLPRGDGAPAVAVVSSFDADEPLEQIVDAARGLPHVRFEITGDPARRRTPLPDPLPGNVRCTGFLPDADYYTLLRSADAVMCLTTRDDTMQRGACEALSIGTPVITSRWPLLERYFHRGTVHVDATADSIRDGVVRLLKDHQEYVAGIRQLREEQRRAWRQAVLDLAAAIDRADPRRALSPGSAS